MEVTIVDRMTSLTPHIDQYGAM